MWKLDFNRKKAERIHQASGGGAGGENKTDADGYETHPLFAVLFWFFVFFLHGRRCVLYSSKTTKWKQATFLCAFLEKFAAIFTLIYSIVNGAYFSIFMAYLRWLLRCCFPALIHLFIVSPLSFHWPKQLFQCCEFAWLFTTLLARWRAFGVHLACIICW